MYKAELKNGNIEFSLHFHESHLAKACGARWKPSSRVWVAKATRLTASAVMHNFELKDIDPAIIELAGNESIEVPALDIDLDSTLKQITLRPRQKQGIEKAWPHPGFALFWWAGSGKTISTIALFNARKVAGLVDKLLIVCPTSIKGVWSLEIDRYSGIPHTVQVFESGSVLKDVDVLVVGVEALSQGGAAEQAAKFVGDGRVMVVVDESSRIKNHSAGRTEKCWELGEAAQFRLILTGTPVTQGPIDLFAQFRFLDPNIIGELSYYSFRNRFAILGGFENRKIVGYRNLEVLMDRIRPFSDTSGKNEITGLPPRSFQVRKVKASPLQHRLCKELVREMSTQLGDKEIVAQNALEIILRLQQIAGGFDPDGNPVSSSNPKLNEVMDVLREFGGKAIIWARFIPEIKAIRDEIEKEWPNSTITMFGEVKSEDRQGLVNGFQSNPAKRFFIVNQQTGSMGLTLTAATLAVYYSNTYSYEERVQSMDRLHRIGQEEPVMYVDVLSDLKVDGLVMAAIENKSSMASYVGNSLTAKDLA